MTRDELVTLKEWVDHEFRGRTIHAEHPYVKLMQIIDLHLDGRYVMVPREAGEWVYQDKVIGHDNHPDYKQRMKKLYGAMITAANTATEQGTR